jgi:hypothetical protein
MVYLAYEEVFYAKSDIVKITAVQELAGRHVITV